MIEFDPRSRLLWGSFPLRLSAIQRRSELFHVELSQLQATIEATFGARDRARGIDGTFRWWVEEVGEVAKSLRRMNPAELEHEIGDALAWLASVANLAGVDLTSAMRRYADGCPRCQHSPCTCPAA
ncbi:MAG TPA: MazG nucleotide pyrophosphohydrolase domain-containing protein [Actinomycetota bacterium]